MQKEREMIYKVKWGINYENIEVEGVDKSICGPAHTVKEVGQREPEWHEFHALPFDNLGLRPL